MQFVSDTLHGRARSLFASTADAAGAVAILRFVWVAALRRLGFASLDKAMSLESILAGEALGAEVAGERLDSQMDSLVTLQVVVAAEGLHALVALEGTLRLSSGLVSVVTVHHMLSAVVLANSHTRNHGHLATWLVDVGHDRAGAHANRVIGISVRSHGLARQTARVVGTGRRGQRRRLMSAIRGETSLWVSGRGSVVTGVARSSRSIRVLHLAAAGRGMRLGGRHDGSVRRSSRCHAAVGVVATDLIRRVVHGGSGKTLGAGGRRLRATLVGKTHGVLRVHSGGSWAKGVLLALMAGRLRVMALRAIGRGAGIAPALLAVLLVGILHVGL